MELSRRELLGRASTLGAAALIAQALPVAHRLIAADPAVADVPIDGATLQAFADTLLPGRLATRTDLGDEIHPQAIAGVDPEPGAVEADALRLFNDPLIGFPTLAPPFLADLNARAIAIGPAPFLNLDFDKRTAVAKSGLAFDNPDRTLWEAAAAVPFTAFCAAATQPNATAKTASGYRVMGLPGTAPGGYKGFSYGKKLARERTKREPTLAERVDVCIVGSGFGGSIAAWRLAELYEAAGTDPKSILVLERGRRFKHTDFRQSMDVGHLSSVYNLIQSVGGTGTLLAPGPNGGQVVTANLVGGGSNLYLAASLRSPTETFERRDHRADDGGDRRMWPSQISRKTLDPYYARAEHALRVRQPSWKQVSKSGGLWAATLNAAGHSCDRVPLAIDPKRCVDAKWCHTGCVFGAKNTVLTNYLGAAERKGVQIRPNREAQQIRRSSTDGYRYVVSAAHMNNEGPNPSRQPDGQTDEIECKVLILAAGAMNTPPILMRSRPDLPSLSDQAGRHLGVNGDHIAALEYDPKKVRSLLRLPGYGQFYKGKPITTMTYDFWVGRRGPQHDGTRFTLQEIFLSSLTNFLYDDGRAPADDGSWWGLQKKQAIANWDNRIELLAMVEDTHDGTFEAVPPQGGAIRPNSGPVSIGTFSYRLSDQSIQVRERADRAMRQVGERAGLAKFMKLTETQGIYASHPLGGSRMAETPELGVVDHRCEAFGNEGLFCMDSSAIPTSLGVNPSLTISAVCERAAGELVSRSADYGLPSAPAGFRHRTPAVVVGERVVPGPRAA